MVNKLIISFSKMVDPNTCVYKDHFNTLAFGVLAY